MITIDHKKETTLKFNLSIDKVSDRDNVIVKFVIEADGMEVAVPCKYEQNDEWSATIPILTFLKKRSYDFHIEVNADDHHFEPIKGLMEMKSSISLLQSIIAEKG